MFNEIKTYQLVCDNCGYSEIVYGQPRCPELPPGWKLIKFIKALKKSNEEISYHHELHYCIECDFEPPKDAINITINGVKLRRTNAQ